MERYKFKEGVSVFHCENLTQKMIVNKIIRKIKKVPTEEIDPDTKKFKRIEKVFIVGIECYWWDENKTYFKQIFHSKLLIPAHIVSMGKESIKVFLES